MDSFSKMRSFFSIVNPSFLLEIDEKIIFRIHLYSSPKYSNRSLDLVFKRHTILWSFGYNNPIFFIFYFRAFTIRLMNKKSLYKLKLWKVLGRPYFFKITETSASVISILFFITEIGFCILHPPC